MENQELAELGNAMSEISERCYCAGWLGGTEYFVPELCRRAVENQTAQPWGYGFIAPGEARALIGVAEKLGYWADLDESATGYVPFDPFPIPPEYIESLGGELKAQKEEPNANE